MKKGISVEMKVGIFALLVLGILTYMTFKVSGREWFRKEGYHVYVFFSNTAGLDERSKVKIAGVDAGIIDSIKLEGAQAKVRILIYPEVKLYKDTVALIKSTGLLGDKYLELRPGSEEPLLKDGDVIQQKIEPVDMDQMVQKIAKISDSFNKLATNINDVFGSEEIKKALKETVKNLSKITENLNTVIIQNDKRLRETLKSIKELTILLSEMVEENRKNLKIAIKNASNLSVSLNKEVPVLLSRLNNVTSELDLLIKDSRPRITKLTEEANRTLVSVRRISEKIERGEGTLGKLITDESLYNSVNEAARGIEKTISRIDRFRTYLTFRGEYLTGVKDGKGYFMVTLKPRPDKYYLLGIVSDPLGKVTTTKTIRNINGNVTVEEETEIKKRIEFTAQFAKRFNNTALRIGIIENTFGFGVDQFFLNDKLRFFADLWDFSSDEEEAKNPHLKIGLDYRFYKGLFLSTGFDNIMNSKWSGVFIGGGITFEDEDFKYLFGTVPKISTR